MNRVIVRMAKAGRNRTSTHKAMECKYAKNCHKKDNTKRFLKNWTKIETMTKPWRNRDETSRFLSAKRRNHQFTEIIILYTYNHFIEISGFVVLAIKLEWFRHGFVTVSSWFRSGVLAASINPWLLGKRSDAEVVNTTTGQPNDLHLNASRCHTLHWDASKSVVAKWMRLLAVSLHMFCRSRSFGVVVQPLPTNVHNEYGNSTVLGHN